MATTKTTAPWNLGYMDGFAGARPADQRSDWDSDQRRAYLDAYQEGVEYRTAVLHDARLKVQQRIRNNT